MKKSSSLVRQFTLIRAYGIKLQERVRVIPPHYLTPFQRMILNAFAFHANDEQRDLIHPRAWPSLAWVAKLCGVPIHRVKGELPELREAGFLQTPKNQRVRRDDGKYSTPMVSLGLPLRIEDEEPKDYWADHLYEERDGLKQTRSALKAQQKSERERRRNREERPRCGGRTKAGQPCQSTYVIESGFCKHHLPPGPHREDTPASSPSGHGPRPQREDVHVLSSRTQTEEEQKGLNRNLRRMIRRRLSLLHLQTSRMRRTEQRTSRNDASECSLGLQR